MNDTEDLIGVLAGEAGRVRRFPAPSKVVGRWAAVALSGIVLFMLAVGTRPDLFECLRQPRYVLDIAAALATAVGAAWAATVSALPGRPLWQRAPSGVPAMVWTGLLVQGAWFDSGPLRPDLICPPVIALLGLPPGVTLVLAMRRGAVLAPCLGMFLAVSASASLAYVGLRLVHPEDAGRMVLVWQFGPVVLLSTLAACLGGRLFPRRLPESLKGDTHFRRSTP